MEDFFTKSLTCKLCSHEFTSLGVRKSKQPVLRTDSDFCPHYQRETPFYYHVYLCPNCGYAFLEASSRPRSSLRSHLAPLEGDYSGPRDAAKAALVYRRAIECAELDDEEPALIASLKLQLAWCYRHRGDWEAEAAALESALQAYIRVYETSETTDISKVSYLIGEIHRRLGNDRDAVFWFSRLVNDKATTHAIRRLAREAWQELRS